MLTFLPCFLCWRRRLHVTSGTQWPPRAYFAIFESYFRSFGDKNSSKLSCHENTDSGQHHAGAKHLPFWVQGPCFHSNFRPRSSYWSSRSAATAPCSQLCWRRHHFEPADIQFRSCQPYKLSLSEYSNFLLFQDSNLGMYNVQASFLQYVYVPDKLPDKVALFLNPNLFLCADHASWGSLLYH